MHTRVPFVPALALVCGCAAHASVAQAPVDGHEASRKPPATPAAVRYALPTCPLGYQVLVREKEFQEDRLDFDTERFMTLEATAQNGRMRLDAVVVGRSIHAGVRDYGKPSADYAPPLLETDGLGWIERDGPTWLFSEVGAPGGLAWFFPTLPGSADRDAPVVWNVPFNSGQSTASLRVEATRGRMPSLKAEVVEHEAKGEKDIEIPTTFTRAEVRFLESHVEQGVGVSTFGMTAEGSAASESGDEHPFSMVRTARGTYAVTATGRVLFAHLQSSRKTTYGTLDRGIPVQHFEETSEAKMHLVRACDGPVTQSIEPKLTAEELAKPADDSVRFEVAPPPPPPKKNAP